MAAIAVDPLIAEARRRARRRRFAFAAALLAAVAVTAVLVPSHGTGQTAADELRAIRAAGRLAFVGDAGITAPDAGWAMNGLKLWYTTDGGAHWRTITPPRLRDQDVIARVLNIRFVDPLHGWLSAPDIPGGRGRYALTFRTTDGGRSWFHGSESCTGCGGALSFLDRTRGFSLVRNELYATRDGGETWRRVASTPAPGTIEFADAR